MSSSLTITEFLQDQFAKLDFTPVDLTGKTIVVTGSNVGLGYETVRHLVEMNPTRVILACRTISKAEEAIKNIKSSTSCDGVIIEAQELDLASFASCRAFAEKYQQSGFPLHILINNAGIGGVNSFALSKDGHESMFATNHLGTALLTLLLLPVIRHTASLDDSTYPRIIILSSEVHHWTQFPEKDEPSIVEAMNDPKNTASIAGRYMVTKLMNVLFARRLAQRLQQSSRPEDHKITVSCVNPGMVNTELGKKKDTPFFRWMAVVVVTNILSALARSGVEGSKTTVYASIHPECGIENGAQGGQYYSSCRPAKVNPIVEGESGDALAEKLWQETIQTVEIKKGEFDI
ncbi:hypothetical protein BGZ49_003603 [Haplosporangium sp. Z 27]|nr:hypothetical protein BGZ49_003603 [Haplosporangium sp. Z 27]